MHERPPCAVGWEDHEDDDHKVEEHEDHERLLSGTELAHRALARVGTILPVTPELSTPISTRPVVPHTSHTSHTSHAHLVLIGAGDLCEPGSWELHGVVPGTWQLVRAPHYYHD